MDIVVIKLTHNNINDFCSLVHLFKEVFEWGTVSLPGKPHLQKLLSKPDFIVVVAKAGAEVVGGLTAYILESYQTEKPSV